MDFSKTSGQAITDIVAPSLTTDMYGRVGADTSNGNLETLFTRLATEQRDYNQLQMEREDSSYQRMVEDMKKAGLNPWLGVSSGGSSSSPMTAPHKSALESLISFLSTHNDAISGMNRDTLNAVNTGIKAAMPFLALLGA